MGGLHRGRVFVAVQHSLATASREPEQISKGIVFLLYDSVPTQVLVW